MFLNLNRSRGQVTAETVVLFGAVIAGLVALGVYYQRAHQGMVKGNADSLGTQFQSNAAWNAYSISKSETKSATGTKAVQKSKNCQGVGGGDAADCDPGEATALTLPQ